MSQTMLASGSAMGSPTPIAAALAAAMQPHLPRPGACTLLKTRPLLHRRDSPRHCRPARAASIAIPARCALRKKNRSIASHSWKSAITPSAKGRTTSIDSGVRPCICLARCPTARPPAMNAPRAMLHGDHRRLIDYDPFAHNAHERIGRAQVERQITAEVLKEALEHPCPPGL